MGTLIKWLAGIIVGIILLAAAAFAYLYLFVDPNDFKGTIAQKVQEQTGREIAIPGDIKLSLSPGFKAVFKLGDISISSNQDFQGTPFVSSERAEIDLALWPLIRYKSLEIDHLTLKGVHLNLVKSSAGKTNWATSAVKKTAAVPQKQAQTTPQKQPDQKPAKPLPKFDIGGVTIKDINVTFIDQQAGQTLKLNNFNCDIGRIQGNVPFPVNANFTLLIDDGKKPLSASIKLTTNLGMDLAGKIFVLDRLNVETDISGAPVEVKSISLFTNATANLAQSQITLNDMEMKIDESTIKGAIEIANLQKPVYKAQLHIDELNLDKYTPAKKEAPATPAKSAGSAPGPATPGPTGQAPHTPAVKNDPQIIPVGLLRGLNFNGDVQIDKLISAKLIITEIQTKATGKDGLIKIEPFTANLYQGSITVIGEIDARPNTPTVKLTKTLKGVEMGPLFMDLKGKEEVKGTADIKVKVSTKGDTKKGLTKNSNGTVNLSMTNGEIAKLKIIDTIRSAKRLYEGKSEDTSTTKDQKKSGRPTTFAELSASGVITNGVLANDDLKAQSELMHFTGKGTVNLNTEEIDYLLTIYLAKKLERDEEKDLVEMSDTPIPYKVKGTFDKIDQSAALGEILKAGAVKFLSRELEKQLKKDSGEQGDKQETDSPGSTEELILKGIEGLFGK